MIKKVYLCGHTGSINRGCEAIVRSTVKILNEAGLSDISVLTFDEKYDRTLGLDKKVRLMPYPQRTFTEKAMTILKRKLFNNWVWGFRSFHKNLFKNIEKDSAVFNIGGDTYCYSEPYLSYALNLMAEENCVPSVFWGCSVEEKVLKNDAMKADINRYSAVIAREENTFETLGKILGDKTKLFHTCDPAFHLEIGKTPLPPSFKDKNTLGINVSPLVFKNPDNDEDIMYKNIRNLIDRVLSETDMAVCLIPHVYNSEKNLQDIKILRKIYEPYKDGGRVSLIEDELSCTEIKYIISRCRFFVGARTHATIAAYSTGVPALALSYSVKSIGIAKDLFGTAENYALSWKSLSSENEISDVFFGGILKNESEILEIYGKVLPEYKQSISDATKKLIETL